MSARKLVAVLTIAAVVASCGGAAQATPPAGTALGTTAPPASPATTPGATNSGAVTAIVGGAFSACALLVDGSVMCWGNNVNGELGNGGTNKDSNVMAAPGPVIGLGTGVRAIAASGFHTNCALLNGGTVKCWGAGALGTGANQYAVATSPTDVPSITGATALFSVGTGFCVIVANGALQCWGSIFGSDLPVAIAGLTDVTAVSGAGAGPSHECVVLTAGTVKCWGGNDAGQLGNGSTTASTAPVDVVGLSGAKKVTTAVISGGNAYSCAVTDAGGVKCWGKVPTDATTYSPPVAVATDLPGFTSGVRDAFNNGGQLGLILLDGSIKHVGLGSNYGADLGTIPAPIQAFSTRSYDDPACVLTVDGRVLCRSFTSGSDPWPMVQGLVVGSSATGPSPSPAAPGTVAAVSLANLGACVLTTSGGAKCWGTNPGNGSTQSSTPVDVLGLTSGVSAVATGAQTCVVTTSGGVKCWGGNSQGQLGNGSTANSLIPVDVTGLTSGATRVVVGSGISCAITTAGGVKCWGINSTLSLNSKTPVDLPGIASGVTDLTLGQNGNNGEICALVSGIVKCWDNAGGAYAWKPVPGLGTDSTAVASGGACAITGTGGLKCWDSLVFFSGAATDKAGLTSGVSAVALNFGGGCVVTSGGGVKCWGSNLGNGTTGTSASPVDVPGLSGVLSIATSGRDTCVVISDHNLQCWGTAGSAPVTLPIP